MTTLVVCFAPWRWRIEIVSKGHHAQFVALVLRHELVDVVLAVWEAVVLERDAQLGAIHEPGACLG
jgi:hypothetical protein